MNIYIGNLHPNVSEGQIKDLFRQYGVVNSVKIILDMETGLSKCFGFIEMDDAHDGRLAIKKLHDQNFMGQFLQVEAAQAKPGAPIKKQEKGSKNYRNN